MQGSRIAVTELWHIPIQASRFTSLFTRTAVWPYVLIGSARSSVIFYVNAPTAILKGHR